jgi:hypothetical protein
VALFTVKASLLGAVAKWACHDESRYWLNFVFFDGKNMVATDGHRMVVVPLVVDGPAFGLHRKSIAALVAMQRELGRKFGDFTVGVENHKATIVLDGPDAPTVDIKAPVVDFPPYEQLLQFKPPAAADPGPCAFNPRYLADIHEVLLTLSHSETVTIKAWGDAMGPVLFEAEGIRFVVMQKRLA